MERLTLDEWAMELAHVTSKRATCCRRSVGCVLVNSRGHVIATGYNGVASGLPHCISGDSICVGRSAASGTNLDGCEAIHAEQNALLQCKDVYSIETAYVTTQPCMTCTKLFLNTSCKRIVFGENYPGASNAMDLWLKSGRSIEFMPLQRVLDFGSYNR